ncbi:wax ester/triacylglycerol synthase domain-containing protein [Nostocoides vanveenii]
MAGERTAYDPSRANAEAWAHASEWGAARRMNDLETLMWRSERHPAHSSTTAALLMLDTAPDWARFRAAHDWAGRLIPRMRQRVQESALPIGAPGWVSDDNFDLDYHLRRVRVPAPGGMPQLLAFAQSAAMVPFDRSRPLWEGTLIEGLPDGKAAYLLKLHHSLTDGLGSVQLLSLLQSRTREHTPDKPVARSAEGADPSANDLAIDTINHHVRAMPSAASKLVSAGVQAITNPRGTTDSALRFVASARRTAIPAAKGSPLFEGRTGAAWRFGVLECELADLKAAAKAASGSVNDAYIAALLGGMRIYHEQHGLSLRSLPMVMPVSLRRDDDPMGGNKWAGAMFAGPMGITDPAERIAVLRGLVLSLRVEPALDSFSFLAPIANLLPSGVGAAAAKVSASADMSASNVPGLPYQTYMAGAKVERVFPFGPLPGVAVMAAMVTHGGTCGVGFNMDGSVIHDTDRLVECMGDGFEEVLALGG